MYTWYKQIYILHKEVVSVGQYLHLKCTLTHWEENMGIPLGLHDG